MSSIANKTSLEYRGSYIASSLVTIPAIYLLLNEVGRHLGLGGTSPENNLVAGLRLGGALLAEAGIALLAKNKTQVLKGAVDSLPIASSIDTLIYGSILPNSDSILGNILKYTYIFLGIAAPSFFVTKEIECK